MGNIILNDNLDISVTKLNLKQENNINDLTFYISKKYSTHSIYAAFVDDIGNFDIVPLTYMQDATNHKIYNIDCVNEMRIKGGFCKMFLFIFDKKLCNSKTSKSIVININIETYNLFHQTYLNRKLNNTIAEYYDKIVKMTELNIELYDKITKEANE